MTDDSTATPKWGPPPSEYRVTLGSDVATFQDISGLDVPQPGIAYRTEPSKAFPFIEMRRGITTGQVMLKKGVFAKGGAFWDWFSGVKMHLMKRQNVTVTLLQPGRQRRVTWTLRNSAPIRIFGTGLTTHGPDIAVAAVALTHAGITVAHP